MRRAAAVAALLAAGCGGLIHRDVPVSQEITAGGVPSINQQIDGAKITAPLAASAGELSRLSSVTLRSVRIESNDSGDVSFLSNAMLTISAANLPVLRLATLPARPAAGTRSVDLATESSKDLRAYLAVGALLDAQLEFDPRPVVTRGLKITLVVRGSL